VGGILWQHDAAIITYLLFSACSGSMQEASCGSMMLGIIMYYLVIYLFIY
jgi:hypothetical protein